MTAKLILLAGYSGAGKTTLEQAALECIDNLQYLKNVTTRPQREKQDDYAYEFVTKSVYERLRKNTVNWNHIDYAGYSYGIDIDTMRALLQRGVQIIGGVIPDIFLINRLRNSFAETSYLIWLDTPLSVANARISQTGGERSIRISEPLQTSVQGENVKRISDYIFKPVGVLDQDKKRFVHLIQSLLI